jgi:hypothetical protein
LLRRWTWAREQEKLKLAVSRFFRGKWMEPALSY